MKKRLGVISALFFLPVLLLANSQQINSIYDAKGNLIASCDNSKQCQYFIYQGVSRIGVVENQQFSHQNNGVDGKAGEITQDQAGVKKSQLWITDFHGSVVAKLATVKPTSILFNAFGQVLNEPTNQDCEDYYYTDKPRLGCTSLHNFNARFYDPKIGRFITTDPVEQHNLNWFIYVNNNPLTFIDPDGQNPRLGEVVKRGIPAGLIVTRELARQYPNRVTQAALRGAQTLNNAAYYANRAGNNLAHSSAAARELAINYWSKLGLLGGLSLALSQLADKKDDVVVPISDPDTVNGYKITPQKSELDDSEMPLEIIDSYIRGNPEKLRDGLTIIKDLDLTISYYEISKAEIEYYKEIGEPASEEDLKRVRIFEEGLNQDPKGKPN